MSRNVAQRTTREQDVLRAIHECSLERLQELSLRPRGFQNARLQAWTFLLGVEPTSIPTPDPVSPTSGRESSLSESWTQSSSSSVPTSPNAQAVLSLEDSSIISEESTSASSHPDAHQVQLDTNRSFILYPVEKHSLSQRKSLQEGLHDIILGVLQKRPRLRYFQGYHDIITVLFLTLPVEVVPISAEKMSLHWLRDSMGTGLDPLVGQLRVLKRLIRLVDPPYAETLEKNSPLPYYALSNLLTLFSHDVPTLPLVQHVFDWLLCREPIATIWLAAAVILSRKQDILALEKEGEDAMGMMHAVLSALPPLSEWDPSQSDDDSRNTSISNIRDSADSSPATDEVMDESEIIEFDASTVSNSWDKPVEVTVVTAPNVRDDSEDKITYTSFDEIQKVADYDDANSVARSPTSDSLSDSWTADMPPASSSPAVPVVDKASNHISGAFKPPLATHENAGDGEKIRSSATPEAEIRPRGESMSSSRSRSHSRSPPGYYEEKRSSPPLPLSMLLRQASELLVKYPPSTPALHVAETFGPQSALHPSTSAFTGMPPDRNDNEAEACVGGEDVVFPPTPEEQEEEFGPPRKPRESGRRPRTGEEKGVSRRLGKGMTIRRQTVVAGVVLLIGVAVALYGFGPGGKGSARNTYRLGGDKRIVGWVGGLLGIGQRLAVGI